MENLSFVFLSHNETVTYALKLTYRWFFLNE